MGRLLGQNETEGRVRPGQSVAWGGPLRRLIAGVAKAGRRTEAFEIAKKRADKDSSMTLDEWQANHHDNVEAILSKLGFSDT